jgi:predicted nucleotidyltransferase
MPVRSLNSSVFKWPNHREVNHAVREWAAAAIQRYSGIVAIGYFGSYARGDWGVGSDVDLLAVVTSAEEPFERRCLAWDLSPLPVPAQLLVYTVDEWEALQRRGGRFARVLANETVWVFP